MTTTVAPQPNTAAPGAVHKQRGRFADKAGLRIGERFASPGRIGALVALVVLAVFWLLPFLWAVATSFKTETAAAATPVSWLPPRAASPPTRTRTCCARATSRSGPGTAWSPRRRSRSSRSW